MTKCAFRGMLKRELYDERGGESCKWMEECGVEGVRCFRHVQLGRVPWSLFRRQRGRRGAEAWLRAEAELP